MPAYPRVLVVGDGVAGSALACLLRDSGFGVTIAARTSGRPLRPPTIEALPRAAARLLTEIGLGAALSAADATTVHGFDNRYGRHVRRVEGTWMHVERNALALDCLRAACHRGAEITHDGASHGAAFAVVDATGRAARWSRPVRRAHPSTATLFSGPPWNGPPRRAYLARRDTVWAYRIDHPKATTVGVITEHRPVDALDRRTAAELGVNNATLCRTGVQACPVQWSQDPIGQRRLAVGDAALALNPIAGQGVRFALSSAFAAAAVIQTWAEAGDERAAEDYYRRFVDGVRTRHLSNLSSMNDGLPADPLPTPPAPLDPDSVLAFTADVIMTGQNRGGLIVAEEAFRLPDGGLVRFVGGVDLTWLRHATRSTATVMDVCRVLAERDVHPATVGALVAWAVQHGILTVTPS